MQIEVAVDYKNNWITRAGEPKFYLIEYGKVDDNGGGTYGAFSSGGATFGEKEWREIYRKGGDFSVVGVSIRRDAPLSNMDGYAQAMRRPRIPVTLLDAASGDQDNEPGANEKGDDDAKLDH